MGIFKSMMGFGGVERVGDRIVSELEAARARGEQEVTVEYSQSEISVRANASQMAVFIRRKIEKGGFEIVGGHGGEFGEDVQMLVRVLPTSSAPANAQAAGDPDLEQLHRSMRAIASSPPTGEEGRGLGGGDLDGIRSWMIEKFDAGAYEEVWRRRLALGYGLSGEGAESDTWFWVNALPALSALRRGFKDHPFVATSAAFAGEAYRACPEPRGRIEEAMSEINARFFG